MAPQDRPQTQRLSRPGEAQVRVNTGFRDEFFIARGPGRQIGAADFQGLSRKFARIAAQEQVQEHNKGFDEEYAEVIAEAGTYADALMAEYEKENADLVKFEREYYARQNNDPAESAGHAAGRRRANAEIVARGRRAVAQQRFEDDYKAQMQKALAPGESPQMKSLEEYEQEAFGDLGDHPMAGDYYWDLHFNNARAEGAEEFAEAYRRANKNLNTMSLRTDTLYEGRGRLMDVAKAATSGDPKASDAAVKALWHWTQGAVRAAIIEDVPGAFMEMVGETLDAMGTEGLEAGRTIDEINEDRMDLLDALSSGSVNNVPIKSIEGWDDMYQKVFLNTAEAEKTEGSRLIQARNDDTDKFLATSDFVKQAQTLDIPEVRELLEKTEADPSILGGEYPEARLVALRGVIETRLRNKALIEAGFEEAQAEIREEVHGHIAAGNIAAAKELTASLPEGPDRDLLERVASQAGAAEFSAFVQSDTEYKDADDQLTSALGSFQVLGEEGVEIYASLERRVEELRTATSRSFAEAEGGFDELGAQATAAVHALAAEIRDLNEVRRTEIAAFEERRAAALDNLDEGAYTSEAAMRFLTPAQRAAGLHEIQKRRATLELPHAKSTLQSVSAEMAAVLLTDDRFSTTVMDEMEGDVRVVDPDALRRAERVYERKTQELVASDEWKMRMIGATPADQFLAFEEERDRLRDETLEEIMAATEDAPPAPVLSPEEVAEIKQLRDTTHPDSPEHPDYDSNIQARDRAATMVYERTALLTVRDWGFISNTSEAPYGGGVSRATLGGGKAFNAVDGTLVSNFASTETIRRVTTFGGQAARFRVSAALDQVVDQTDNTHLHPVRLEAARKASVPGSDSEKEAIAKQERVRAELVRGMGGRRSDAEKRITESALGALVEATWLTPEEVRKGRVGSVKVDWTVVNPLSTRILRDPDEFLPEFYAPLFDQHIAPNRPDITLDQFLDAQLSLQ